MRKGIKGICAILSAAVICSCIGACGIKDSGKTVVSVWSDDASSKALMTKLVDEYNKGEGAQKGISIDYVVHGSDYGTVLQMAIANSQTPDIYKLTKTLTDTVDSNEIVSLEEVDGLGELVDKYRDDVMPRINIVNNKIYTLPQTKSAYGIVYNKDLFKKAGIVDENGEAKPPVTWDDVREAAKKITNESERTYGIVFPIKYSGFWVGSVMNAGYSSAGRNAYDRENDKYDFSIYKKGLDTVCGIKEDKSYFPGPEGLDNDQARAQFAEGRIGMIFAGSWDVGVYNTQFIAKCDWGVTGLPVDDANGKKYYPYCAVGSSYGISTEGVKKHSKEIAEVYKYLCSDNVRKQSYENGLSIPLHEENYQDVNFKEGLKGWDEFAKIASKSQSYISWINLKLEDLTMNSGFDKVWAGDMTTDEAIEALNASYNKAYEVSKELYADDLKSSYAIDKSYFDKEIKE